LRGPISKERGREGRGRRRWEGKGGEGREGEWKERAMSPHYLEEVYAYAQSF